jgi:predicted CXXCH cytochrome family protein
VYHDLPTKTLINDGLKTMTVMRGILVPIFFIILIPAIALAEGPSCDSCHENLTAGKSVHPAIAMGCAACHTAVDATDVPHKITNRNPKGLSAKMRDLCYSCHDRTPFMKNTVHGAVMLGCTSCHDPHTSDHAKLLKEAIPQLCLTCHENPVTAQKGATHAMTGKELCSTCHNPHATDAPKLVESGRGSPPDDRTTLAAKPDPKQRQ